MKNKLINIFVPGMPTPRKKTKGNIKNVSTWKKQIINSTIKYTGIIKDSCKLKVVFFFDKSQYPKDYPFGPDLDNYIKSLQDALNETIFLKAPGKDSCVILLHASKYRAKNNRVGARIKVFY